MRTGHRGTGRVAARPGSVALRAFLLGVLALGSAGCSVNGSYRSPIGKHPFILEIEGGRFVFHQLGIVEFPRFEGEITRTGRAGGWVELVGRTGRADVERIHFRVRRARSLADQELEFSLDGEVFTSNGWTLIEGTGAAPAAAERR